MNNTQHIHTFPQIVYYPLAESHKKAQAYTYTREIQGQRSGLYSHHELIQSIACRFEPFIQVGVYKHTCVGDVPFALPHYALCVPTADSFLLQCIGDIRMLPPVEIKQDTLLHASQSAMQHVEPWRMSEKVFFEAPTVFANYTFTRNAVAIPPENALCRVQLFSQYGTSALPKTYAPSCEQSVEIRGGNIGFEQQKNKQKW